MKTSQFAVIAGLLILILAHFSQIDFIRDAQATVGCAAVLIGTFISFFDK